jgi:hypothetical protein
MIRPERIPTTFIIPRRTMFFFTLTDRSFPEYKKKIPCRRSLLTDVRISDRIGMVNFMRWQTKLMPGKKANKKNNHNNSCDHQFLI